MSAELDGRVSYRFASFEVLPHLMQLRRNGVRLKLREQPFRILLLMIERPGELISRDELRRELWPDHTFVDFDKCLNTAVNNLRQVLCDSASRPRFIETVTRHGYRFIGSVEKAALSERSANRSPQQKTAVPDESRMETRPVAGKSASQRGLWLAGSLCIVLGVAGAAAYLTHRPTARRSNTEWLQLTAVEAAVQPALSPDGRMLAFIRGQGTFFGPGEIYVKLLPDGEPVQLTHDRLPKMRPIFSPDGSRLAWTVVDRNFAWDTWTVPVLGGEPRLWLRNASGLEWTDARHILFSEIRGGLHMGLVLASETRTEARDIYFPPHERGMVHRASVSPDGKWIVFTEMDNRAFLPCRVIPFDRSAPAQQIGPASGECLDAAWSRDGRQVYLNSNAGGTWHIWRQRFPEGRAEQLTSGPTEEAGVFVAPDGRTILTSVGFRSSSLWIHDEQGEREIAIEGSPYFPSGSHQAGHVFSPDGRKLYCLVDRQVGASSGSELWVFDIESRSAARAFPGIAITGGYDVSGDGKRIAFVGDANGLSGIFIAALDGSSPPQRLNIEQADDPCIANDDALFFRAVEGSKNFVWRADAGALRKIMRDPILILKGCSPDGQWIAAIPNEGGDRSSTVLLYSARNDGPPRLLCRACMPVWSRDGRFLYLSLSIAGGNTSATTYAIRLRPGETVPAVPLGGITEENIASLPIARVYREGHFYPGADLSTYSTFRESTHRNIYRIPLP